MTFENFESRDLLSVEPLKNGMVAEHVTHKAAEEESFGSKLQREAELLKLGAKQGITKRITEIVENPGTTSLQVAAAIAVGATLGALNAAGGRYGTVARIGSGMAFAYGATQAGVRLFDIEGAMRNVWNDPLKFDESKERVANNLGGLMVDLPLFLGSAALADRAVGNLLANHMLSRGVEPFVGRPNFLSVRPNLQERYASVDAAFAAFGISRSMGEIRTVDGRILSKPFSE